MNVWTAQSHPGRQSLLAWGMTLVGGVLTYTCRAATTSNTQAGFWTGLFLLALGVWGLLSVGTQTIVIDPQKRRITVTDQTRLGHKERVIRFGEITEVGIGYLGKRSNFVQCYSLSLLLRSGERYPLFAPGRFFDGSNNEATAQGWRDRLEGYLHNKNAV